MDAPDGGFRGSLAETPLPQVLREIFLDGLKGTLTIIRREETRNLFFENGELRTATSSREGQRIGAFLKRRGWITDKDLVWALETVARQGRARLGKILLQKKLVTRAVLEAEMRRLVEEIVFSSFEWDHGEYSFRPSSGVLDPDVALSLSTAALIVEGVRRLPESDVFRGRLGEGKRVLALSTDPMFRFQYLPLTPQEAYLLSRVDGVLDLESLLKIAGTSRAAAAKTLYALFSCGIIEWKSDGAAIPPAGGLDRLNVEVTAEPPTRIPGHADMVRNTYRRIDWLTHYELLIVDSGASPEEILKAYYDRSRLFHPDLRHRSDLARCEKELVTVFGRLKEAFATLSDPKAREAYDASLFAPPRLAGGESDPGARKDLAARSYERAQQLIAEKDFHPAAEMLLEAVRFVPDKAEYRFSLGRVELQNENWVDRGLENLKAAARLDPKRTEYLREAARELHRHGHDEEAEIFARRLADVEPEAENREFYSRIQAARKRREKAAEPVPPEPEPVAAKRPTLLGRIFRHRT